MLTSTAAVQGADSTARACASFAVLTDIDVVEERIIWGVGMKILLSGILEFIMQVHTVKETPPSYFSDGSWEHSSLVFLCLLFSHSRCHIPSIN